ncbi:hypothetical protein J4573_49525 [Actinomadura barringtoniae]|uniref:Uncharacterized protein n=1 Tax=Actinomadura barringtoniae TaxID=1427535 RepID=A0A939PM81_9ACTN|nr:hypothetical protein [Actinomadura barringtoniae]MBO2455205.1 hypothetical protein [Actinomadura barringtoniae]
MIATEETQERRRRCGHHLARLRMLATPDHVLSSGCPVSEVEAGVRAVLQEVEAAHGAAPNAADRLTPVPGILAARLERLRVAADDLVDAATAGDAPGLRRRLWTFESLTEAMWTVQAGLVPETPRRGRRSPRSGRAERPVRTADGPSRR